jgi:hypothetical protein
MPKKYIYRVQILSDDHLKILHYFQEDKIGNIVKKLQELKGIKTSVRSLNSLKNGKIPAGGNSKLKNILIDQEEVKSENRCTYKTKCH